MAYFDGARFLPLSYCGQSKMLIFRKVTSLCDPSPLAAWPSIPALFLEVGFAQVSVTLCPLNLNVIGSVVVKFWGALAMARDRDANSYSCSMRTMRRLFVVPASPKGTPATMIAVSPGSANSC